MSPGQELYAQLFHIGSRGGARFPEPGDLFESVIEDAYTHVLSPGDLALDGGAHVGRHAFPMAKCAGTTGLVLAVEAHPSLARELVKRARKRGLAHVEIVPAALSNQVGRVSFHCPRQHAAYSGVRARRYDFNDDVQLIEVEAATIDSLLVDRASLRLKFVKLDLEGGEFRALEGGAATLRSHRPLIVFENDQDRSAENYGYSKEEFFKFFDAIGYELFTLWGQPYRRPDWGRRDIPWYFFAVSAGSTEADFVQDGLHAILELYRRLL